MADVQALGLTKTFGTVQAVRDLTFTAPAGQVTGFLGPNGSGKTTSLRMLLGLVRPTAGRGLIGGRPYEQWPRPRRIVGAMLEATGFHPGRTGGDHLRVLARAAGLPAEQVGAVLERVDLADAADRRTGGYSLGMRQRLGLAAALLGDPEVLILDEPANGLDPAGMAWLRTLLREEAARGRTVLVSSHVLSEVAQTVDRVVIVSSGVLRFDGPLRELGGAGAPEAAVKPRPAGDARATENGGGPRGYPLHARPPNPRLLPPRDPRPLSLRGHARPLRAPRGVRG